MRSSYFLSRSYADFLKIFSEFMFVSLKLHFDERPMFFALHFDFIRSSLIFAIRVLINFTRQLLRILYFLLIIRQYLFIPRSLCVHFLANYRFWRINAFCRIILLILPTNFGKIVCLNHIGTPTCLTYSSVYIIVRIIVHIAQNAFTTRHWHLPQNVYNRFQVRRAVQNLHRRIHSVFVIV